MRAGRILQPFVIAIFFMSTVLFGPGCDNSSDKEGSPGDADEDMEESSGERPEDLPLEAYDYCHALNLQECECSHYTDFTCKQLRVEQLERLDVCTGEDHETMLDACKAHWKSLEADETSCHKPDVEECELSEQCGEGYYCWRGLCRLNRTPVCPMESCMEDQSCVALTDSQGNRLGMGVCSVGCTSLCQCAAHERCATLGDGRSFCGTRCTQDEDCLENQECMTLGEWQVCFAKYCDPHGVYDWNVAEQRLECLCFAGWYWNTEQEKCVEK